MYQKLFLRMLWCALLVCSSLTAGAQRRAHVYMNQQQTQWDVPIVVDSIRDITTSSHLDKLLFNVSGDLFVPFDIRRVDSLTFEDEPLQESKDPYQVFQLFVTTRDTVEITSKDSYVDCHVALNARGSYSNISVNGQIRGRGNSSFLWYDKKPYRIKLNQKHKMLGLSKAKSWVLLANYRDITDMMNTFVFETGRWLGLPFTNHTRYVELFVNGDYRGVYQLTEQVQQGSSRVDVSDDRGILISLDSDDGPDLSPDADDNCWTTVYHMPMCVKYPDDEHFTSHTVDSVRTVFAELERAIKDHDYAQVCQLLDVPSFIKYLQLQEFVYNVELSAPRSIFMHKDGDGPWVMGPLWDFDAGYDFDWGNMYTGHTFFTDYRETVMGSNPLKRNGNYNYVPQFFTDLFACPEFVEAYKAQWAAVKDSIVSHGWNECMRYVSHLRQGAIQREEGRWPIRQKSFETELEKMHQWLLRRADFMTTLIDGIPMPEAPVTDTRYCGSFSVSKTMEWSYGYSQPTPIHIRKNRVLSLMGIDESDFNEAQVNIVPLYTDGTEGPNGTNGTFGAWFDGDGNPGSFSHGHVYIEVFSDIWNWNCGLEQWRCFDDAHTVTMQIQYPHEGTLLKVDVQVNFTIQ